MSGRLIFLAFVLLLYAGEGTAKEEPPGPEPPPEWDQLGLMDFMLTKVPEEDLSWIFLRSIVGEDLWDNAVAHAPGPLREVAIPGWDPAVPLVSKKDQNAAAWTIAGLGQSCSLSVTSVLDKFTRLITTAGGAMMMVADNAPCSWDPVALTTRPPQSATGDFWFGRNGEYYFSSDA